jgi:hypothetical protein
MYPVSSEILTIEQLSLTAIVTVAAQFRVISSDFVSQLESRHIFADFDNYATGFVSSDHRHSRIEISIVDVEISTAHTAGFHYARCQLWFYEA